MTSLTDKAGHLLMVAALAGLTASAAFEARSNRAAGGDAPAGTPSGNANPLPEGALARMGDPAFRHEMPNQLPTFSPDGKTLVTGSANEICFWDPVSGRLLGTIQGVSGYWKTQFSGDGRWLACGTPEHSITLFDPRTRERLLDIRANGPAMASSADGKQVVAAGNGGSVLLFDTTTGKMTKELTGGHSGPLILAQFTPDGKGLVTFAMEQMNQALGAKGGPGAQIMRAGRPYSLCHWDLANGKLEKKVPMNFSGPITSQCLSPDGRSLAVSIRAEGAGAGLVRMAVAPAPAPQPPAAPPAAGQSKTDSVFVFDTGTGLELKLEGTTELFGYAISYSDDGKLLATTVLDNFRATEKTEAAIWDAGTGKLRTRFPVPPRAATQNCLSHDGRMLATVGMNPQVYVWDVATGKPAHNASYEGIAQKMAFLPDSSALVAGTNLGKVQLWEVKSGKKLRNLGGHTGEVTGLAVMPNGSTIVSSGKDGCISIESTNGKENRSIFLGQKPAEGDQPTKSIFAFALAPDGKRAVTYDRSRDGSCFDRVWNLDAGKAIVERRNPSTQNQQPVFSLDARLAFFVERQAFGATSAVLGIGGAKSRTAATKVRVKDAARGKQVIAFDLPANSGPIAAVAPDGRTFVTFVGGKTMKIWETATGKPRQSFDDGNSSSFALAAFAPDARTIATASADKVIRFWDAGSGKELLRRSGPLSRVQQLAFSPDGKLLATSLGDGTILVWGTPAVKNPAPVQEKAEPKQIDEWFANLADNDSAKANQAIWRLTAAPEQAVSKAQELLHPVKNPDEAELRSAIADLDTKEFARRESASNRLANLGELAVPAMEAALHGNPSAEQRQRIEAILENAPQSITANTLRDLRAVEVLEHIGTPPARQVITNLAQGAPGARQTQEAKAALARLTHEK